MTIIIIGLEKEESECVRRALDKLNNMGFEAEYRKIGDSINGVHGEIISFDEMSDDGMWMSAPPGHGASYVGQLWPLDKKDRSFEKTRKPAPYYVRNRW